jgi:hypothetical protein
MNHAASSRSAEPLLAEVVEVVEAELVAEEVVPLSTPPPVLLAEPVDVPTEVVPLAAPVRRTFWGVLGRCWRGLASACEWLFGTATLIIGLAVLAALPVLQFLALGYLLEVSGRIGRSGRLRDGFIGMRKAARVGTIVLCVWLLLLPLRFVSGMAFSAAIIDPDGKTAARWRLALLGLTIAVVLHILAACSRGGRLRHFVWPFTNPIWLARRLGRGGYLGEARDAVWDFVCGLRLPYYFWLGLRGFLGGLAWLFVPVTLLAIGRVVPPVGLLGVLVLVPVVCYLPFLQARFAAENRFRALFEARSVRAHFRRAPWAFAFALLLTLVLAVPLYLLRLELPPRDIAWLPSLFFVVFTFPTRVFAGWAYGRGDRRPSPRHWFFRWTGRLAPLPVVAVYILIVWAGQFVTWDGFGSLYAQHAFLVPTPFMGQ